MKLQLLLSPWVSSKIPDIEIADIENDSRKIKPRDLFFAYPGSLADGRLFIQQAADKGAAAIVYDPINLPQNFKLISNVSCVPLEDLGKVMAAIASKFYDSPSKNLNIIGVTGTNGKTTIAYQLAQAYSLLDNPAAYVGTIGEGDVNSLQPLINTTPDALCLQKLLSKYNQFGYNYVCMEVSSHALSQNRVDYVDFDAAIFTNLSHDHLDYHHTLEAYAEAKALLFKKPTLKLAIINHDDQFGKLMGDSLNPNCKKITYGFDEGSDIRVIKCQVNMQGSLLELISPWGKIKLQINLLGKFNIYNSLAVFISLMENGIPLHDAINVMTKLKPAPGRMEVVAEKPCVIVDYAHTPDALENVLATINKFKKGRVGVVFGCGGDRDKTKRPIMGNIASMHADFVIITSDNPRGEEPNSIIKEINAGITSGKAEIINIVDRKEAIEYALKTAKEDDIILIAGKGHESYQIIGKNTTHFSDQEVVSSYLN